MSRIDRAFERVQHIDPMLLALIGRKHQGPFGKMYLGGTFDCLHIGHLELFRNARKVALWVTVGLNTDEFATRYKRKPLQDFENRYEVLTECRLVDQVVTNFGDENSCPAILESGADAIGHGDDWTGDALMKQMGFDAPWLQQHGIQMVYLPYTAGVSTTGIVNRARTRTQEDR